MRKKILVRGLVLLIVGGIFMVFGVLTGTSKTTMTSEDVFDSSYRYDFLGNHEYKTTANLAPGTYKLRYNFSSTETVREFYVKVLDIDGSEIISVYGPPTVYQNQSAQLNFDTPNGGQHALILGGRWISVQVNLYKEAQSTKIIYPYEIVLYLGLLLFMGGAVSSIFGVLMKEKGQERWIDRL
jgi:hypothetical protein